MKKYKYIYLIMFFMITFFIIFLIFYFNSKGLMHSRREKNLFYLSGIIAIALTYLFNRYYNDTLKKIIQLLALTLIGIIICFFTYIFLV